MPAIPSALVYLAARNRTKKATKKGYLGYRDHAKLKVLDKL
jgi:hypothetical protein